MAYADLRRDVDERACLTLRRPGTIGNVKAKIRGKEGITLDQQHRGLTGKKLGLLSGYDIQTLAKSEAYLSALWARCQGEPIFGPTRSTRSGLSTGVPIQGLALWTMVLLRTGAGA